MMSLLPPIILSLFYLSFIVLLANLKAKWEKWAEIPVTVPADSWGPVS